MNAATILNGREVAAGIKESLKKDIQSFYKQYNYYPGLGVILVGDNPSSVLYVQKKLSLCEELSICCQVARIPSTAPQEEVDYHIKTFNKDPQLNGILLQLPLPSHMNPQRLIRSIDPSKDIDGMHPYNLGALATNQPGIISCTPKGILSLLTAYNIALKGKHVVVVGRSTIVGRPMGLLALNNDATVTFIHRQTQDWGKHTKQADILIVAAGHAHLIQAEHIKEGAVIVDVGNNLIPNQDKIQFTGDVDFESVAPKASFISPVPGGVGPMTVISLMQNIIEAAFQQESYHG